MAYVFFPPRTSNFFPAGPPYLSGLRGFGLGDYASDLKEYRVKLLQYQRNKKIWDRAKKAHDEAVAAASAQGAAQAAAYGIAKDNYTRDKTAWDKEYRQFISDGAAYNDEYAAIKRVNTDRSKTIAKSYGLTLPQSYYDGGACVTQATHDQNAKQCVTVKGLMGIALGSIECGYKTLPICNYPQRPTIRTEPKPPALPVYPKVPALSAEPVAPVAPTPPPAVVVVPQVPVPVVTTPVVTTPVVTTPVVATPEPITPEPVEPEPARQVNMVRNGLLLVALLGGGYLVYRTLKKPKAA